MGVNLVVAVTDGTWFDVLRRYPDLSEVNFWSPSTTNFKALRTGELFLFKLHRHDKIVGGGIFTHATTLPCSWAWEAFGRANGAHTAQEMRALISRYRDVNPDGFNDFNIGCRILTQPFFLDESEWISVPPSWSPNIVRFKTYNTDDAEGMSLWEAVKGRLLVPYTAQESARFGRPHLILPRLGQGAFRAVITDIYERRCAVTRERTLPALDAAHIRPYGEGGAHKERNGLLLRRDIHSLFDTGYVTVTPDFKFKVSARIEEEFGNGRDYRALAGQPISVPQDHSRQPDREILAWHNEHRFLE